VPGAFHGQFGEHGAGQLVRGVAGPLAFQLAHAPGELVRLKTPAGLSNRPSWSGLDAVACGHGNRLGCRKPAPPGQMLCGTRCARSGGWYLAARSWLGLKCDDLRLAVLKLIFLVVTRAVSVLGLSRREVWWKDAEILMLRHRLAMALSLAQARATTAAVRWRHRPGSFSGSGGMTARVASSTKIAWWHRFSVPTSLPLAAIHQRNTARRASEMI
jgi:hypothetical protein